MRLTLMAAAAIQTPSQGRGSNGTKLSEYTDSFRGAQRYRFARYESEYPSTSPSVVPTSPMIAPWATKIRRI
jgi:hypothetical protein